MGRKWVARHYRVGSFLQVRNNLYQLPYKELCFRRCQLHCKIGRWYIYKLPCYMWQSQQHSLGSHHINFVPTWCNVCHAYWWNIKKTCFCNCFCFCLSSFCFFCTMLSISLDFSFLHCPLPFMKYITHLRNN
jgi:hypothetical protein